jgi:hypothetical protein
MDSYRRSFTLYKNLIGNQEIPLRAAVGTPYPSQFNVNINSADYYKILFIDLIDTYKQGMALPVPPNDQNCTACKNHFLGSPPIIDHEGDLKIGGVLEAYFCDFLNEYFKVKKLQLQCIRADTDKLNMPDFKIINLKSSKIIFYFEFKCIFKPFITVHKKIRGAQCYSQSLTLDCDEKLTKQKALIRENNILLNTAYVYWYDIPCLKGIFWQFSKRVFEYEQNAHTYGRKEQAGDYKGGKKVGHTDKLYLPIHGMNNFDSFFQHLISIQDS